MITFNSEIGALAEAVDNVTNRLLSIAQEGGKKKNKGIIAIVTGSHRDAGIDKRAFINSL